jgi:hypothetical protein
MTFSTRFERLADRIAPAMLLFLGLVSAFATAGVTI